MSNTKNTSKTLSLWLYVYRKSLNNKYDVKLHHNDLDSLLEYALQLNKNPDVCQIQITNGLDFNMYVWNDESGIVIPAGFKHFGVRWNYSPMMIDDLLPAVFDLHK